MEHIHLSMNSFVINFGVSVGSLLKVLSKLFGIVHKFQKSSLKMCCVRFFFFSQT